MLYGLLLLMELVAGFTVVVGTGLLDLMGTPYSVFWVFLLGGAAGLLVGLAVAAFGPKQPWSQVVLLGVGLLTAVLLSLPVGDGVVSSVVLAILIGAAYWRGLVVTIETPDHAEVQRRFGYGLAILFFGILWLIARGSIYHRSIWQMVAALGIGYILIAMTALVTARVAPSRERGAAPAVLLAVGLELAVVLGLSIGALELLSVDITSWLAHITQPFWDAAGPALTALGTLLFEPVAWLVHFIRSTAHPSHGQHVNTPQIGHFGGRKVKRHHTSNEWALYLGAAVAALLAGGVAYLIWRTLPRIQRKAPPSGFQEERRSILSLAGAFAAFVAWLRGLLHRAAEGVAAVAHGARVRVLGPTYPVDPVRRLYAQLLHRASTVGLPRATAATPAEFAGTLSARWPQGASDFEVLTTAYEVRRYGEIDLDQEEIARLRESWHRARLLLRRPRKSVGERFSEQFLQ